MAHRKRNELLSAPAAAPAPHGPNNLTHLIASGGGGTVELSASKRPLIGSEGQAGLSRGSDLGRYVVLGHLGSGGLGDVYSAYDPELHRQVAVKVLRPSAARDEQGMARLVREAQALAQLQHPNVVAVHDVGRLDHGVFIAMEKVEGITLSDWRKEPHPWREVRRVFREAGKGLAAAHAAGMVHRDFKPANVIMSSDGRVRVLDFGLARAIERTDPAPVRREDAIMESSESEDWDNPITRPGSVIGTPQYMAPEQFYSENVGPAVDQFSFCVAFWEALYGQRPFLTRDADELFELVCNGGITDPKDHRGVPAWLRKTLRRGLAPQPDHRWPSLSDLLREIDRDVRTRRRGWIGLVTTSVVSATIAGAAALFIRPPPTESDVGVVENVVDDARKAAARTHFVYPPAGEPETPTAFQRVLELEAIEGSAERLADERAAELRVEFADTLTQLGDSYWEREGGAPFASDYYAAALVFDPRRTHARDRTMLTPGELAGLRHRASEASFGASELEAAESLAVLAAPDDEARTRRLSAWYDRIGGPSVSSLARLEALLEDGVIEAAERGSSHRNLGKRDEAPAKLDSVPVVEDPAPAQEPLPDAEEVLERDHTNEAHPAKAKELARRGTEAMAQGKFQRAESIFHQALGHDRRTVTAIAGLAELHFELGHYQQSLKYAKKVVALAPNRARYRILLGDAHFKTHNYRQARTHYEKAKQIGHRDAEPRLRQLEHRLGG